MTSRPSLISEAHLHRKAIAYLRQSSAEQVRENTGSTALQRDLPVTAAAWGWQDHLIEVVDEDLGASAATPGTRRGFLYVLEEIDAARVGLVLVTDINRLGRNIVDVATFATACQRHDVLLSHGGQLVSFVDSTGPFLAMVLGANAARENQARTELSKRARRKKAEAGHASTPPPMGYVAVSNGQWIKDPNPRVRNVIALIFDLFVRLGTGGAVVRALRTRGIQMPVGHSPTTRGWGPAVRHQIHRVLTHPAYKGAYIFGQCKNDGSLTASGRRGAVRRPMGEWVYIEGHHEAYVAPPVWGQIQEQLRKNRNSLTGPLGRGEALVQGILKCTVHLRSFVTTYPKREKQPDGTVKLLALYHCVETGITGFYGSCSGVGARALDVLIERELLATLSPPSVNSIEAAARQALREHEAFLRGREDEIRRCKQAIADAERDLDQTDATQPLVRKRFADRLEVALRNFVALEASHRLQPVHPPFVFDDAEIQELRRLLEDLPRLWRHECVTAAQRKAVVRTAIRAVHATPGPEVWRFEIEWIGGARSDFLLPTYLGVRAEVERARREGLTVPQIVEHLLRQGFVQRKGHASGTPYTERAVREVIRGSRRNRSAVPGERSEV